MNSEVTAKAPLSRSDLLSQSSPRWGNQDIPFFTTIRQETWLGPANVQLFAALEQKNRQLQVLGRRLAEAEEAERRRLACELHDQVGQSLTAMGLNLDIIRTLLPADLPEEVTARLDDLRSLVTHTSQRVRQVMVELRPEALDDYGLLAALRCSADRFAKRTGIAVKVEGEEAEGRLPVQVENVLYRVAQEALTNVAKHAQASQVSINLRIDSQRVYLSVTDNGLGFAPGGWVARDQGQHWGLALMAERIEGVGGRFHLESHPGQGTRIMTEVPR